MVNNGSHLDFLAVVEPGKCCLDFNQYLDYLGSLRVVYLSWTWITQRVNLPVVLVDFGGECLTKMSNSGNILCSLHVVFVGHDDNVSSI